MADCDRCVFRAEQNRPFRCNYAYLTGKTRKGQPPENCTYFQAGQRLETPEEAERFLSAERKPVCWKKPNCRRVAGGPDWEVGWDLYQQGWNDGEIARALGCGTGTVYQWRKRNGLSANAAPGWKKRMVSEPRR